MIVYHMATVHGVIFAALIFCCTAQEFSFTASCSDKKLSTNVDDKLDKLIDTCIMSRDSLTSANSTTLDLTCLPSSYVPGSCKDIKDKWPTSTSGYYTIATANGCTSTVYCHMEDLCDTSGPWTRVAHLDMKDHTQNCPSGFREATSNGVRACWRQSSSTGSCSSTLFSPPSDGYTEVCGKVIGYQYYTTNAVITTGISIDSYYVDGVSLTHGLPPRQHIWTFMAGYYDTAPSSNNCPCSTGSLQSVPAFVGEDYFCESGNSEGSMSSKLYASDPLWDGEGCGSLEGECCNGLPWFYKQLDEHTTDNIEMRICATEATAYEDSPVELFDIYVK